MAGDMVLADAVTKVRRRVQQIRAHHESIGEQNTKATLIDPVLRALGWDTEELDEVCREYRKKPQDNPVDYALLINRAPKLILEAKDLGTSLSDRKWISQTLSYATVCGVTWCVLTNGDEYRFYNAHAPVDVEEKIFRTIRISDDSQHDRALSTLGLLSRDSVQENLIGALWDEHFIDRRVKLVLDELFETQDSGLLRLIRSRVQELTPSGIRDSLGRADIRISYPTAHVRVQVDQSAATTEPAAPVAPDEVASPVSYDVSIGDLIQAGIITPPLQLEAKYHGTRLHAVIEADGVVSFGGKRYSSLSMSAGYARVSVIGPPRDGRQWYNTNGWKFWRYRDPNTGNLLVADHLRQLHLARQGRIG